MLNSADRESERCSNCGVRFMPTRPPHIALAGWNSKMPPTEPEACSSWSQGDKGDACTCSYFNKWLAIFRYIWKDPSVNSVLRECQEDMRQGEHEVSRTRVLISQMFQSTKKCYGIWPYRGRFSTCLCPPLHPRKVPGGFLHAPSTAYLAHPTFSSSMPSQTFWHLFFKTRHFFFFLSCIKSFKENQLSQLLRQVLT